MINDRHLESVPWREALSGAPLAEGFRDQIEGMIQKRRQEVIDWVEPTLPSTTATTRTSRYHPSSRAGISMTL
jgi:hypothetical protein